MTVKIKVTTIEEVTANQIVSLSATLTDGTVINVTTPLLVGDWQITDLQGAVSFLTDADFQSAKISEVV